MATPTREDPTSTATSTATATSAEGQLIDIDGATSAASLVEFKLISDVTVSPDEFEVTWTNLSV